MKDPAKIQKKLAESLRNHPNLRVSVPSTCTHTQLREIAWVIKDYVTHSGDVTNDDPLHEWLEEFHFYLNQR